MAGTIAYSLSQQLDKFGDPLAGGRLDIFQAGTVATRQNAYSDSGLTVVLPNPIVLDEAGRLPQFFLADGLIKIRLSDKDGNTQVTADNIQVVGPSGGGGGGATVDATTVLATGDIKVRYGTSALTGFVRLNARTIGSVTSGATERANADCQALFEYLWGVDNSLSVSGGRGASANADWVSNKTMTLPDCRGRALSGLDDMGSGASGRYSGAVFASGNSIALGSAITGQITITQANIPNYNLSITNFIDTGHTHPVTNFTDTGHSHPVTNFTDSGHSHTVIDAARYVGTSHQLFSSGTGSALDIPTVAASLSETTSNNTTGITFAVGNAATGINFTVGNQTTGISFQVNSAGSGAALSTFASSLLVTTYIKL